MSTSTATNTTPEATAPKRTKFFGARVFSIAALLGSVCGVGYLANTGYHVATDAFVVPVVLSPDSDLVIQSRLSRAALLKERMRIVSSKEQIEGDLEAAEQAIEQLKGLQASASKSLEWTTAITQRQAFAGSSDLRALATQRSELATMVASQDAFVQKVRKDLDAGLVSKAEFVREQQALSQMRVAAIENDRARMTTQAQMSQVMLARQAMSGGRGGVRMATPEMLLQQDQLVRIQCDLLKLEAERRSKTAERRHIDEEVLKIDELIAQLNKRPIFRAIDASTNIAFIPYTQMDGVATGGKVYECKWGVFSCMPVGRVTELLPGEVIVTDPWGSPARGQYAVIDLDDQHAAQSKTLRVRPSGVKAAVAARTAKSPTLASK